MLRINLIKIFLLDATILKFMNLDKVKNYIRIEMIKKIILTGEQNTVSLY